MHRVLPKYTQFGYYGRLPETELGETIGTDVLFIKK